MGVGGPGGRLDRLGAGAGVAIGNVAGHRVVEQHGVLIHHRDQAAQIGQGQLAQIDAIEGDGAGLGFVEAAEEIDDRALAAAAGTHQGHGAAAGQLQIELVDHRVVAIGETHAPRFQPPLETGQRGGLGRIHRIGRRIEDGKQLLSRRETLLQGGVGLRQPLERGVAEIERGEEGEETAGGAAAIDHRLAAVDQHGTEAQGADQLHQRLVHQLGLGGAQG